MDEVLAVGDAAFQKKCLGKMGEVAREGRTLRFNVEVVYTMEKEKPRHFTLLGHIITPELVREVSQKASNARWGRHLLRWRYFEVQHDGVTYPRNALIPSGLWHLLKRVYIDQDWPMGASQEDLDRDIQETVRHPETEIYIYGYYRTEPPRLQWGFLNPQTGIAVVYDMEANLIATIFKPEEGTLFFEGQIDAVKIDRMEWNL